MDGIKLMVSRKELVTALKVLGRRRRRRFSSVVPIWLYYDPDTGELALAEDRGIVLATVHAAGCWPRMGATVDLFLLRRTAERLKADNIELVAVGDAILIPTPFGHVKLYLLPFGTEPLRRTDEDASITGPAPLSDLPLFRWGSRRGPIAHSHHRHAINGDRERQGSIA